MKFIAIKTEDGTIKGKFRFNCEALEVSRQALRNYLASRNKPWKYEHLAELIKDVIA